MILKYHAVSIGETQSGKTYSAIQLLQSQKGTLRFYINTKRESKYLPQMRMIFSDPYNLTSVLEDVNILGLNNPNIYCFNPPYSDKKFKLVASLLETIFLLKQSNQIPNRVIVCIDEVKNYKRHKEAMDEITRIALQGEGMGLILYSVSQRITHHPPDIRDNTDIFLVNKSKNNQLEFMIQEGLIDEIPDQYHSKDRNGDIYLYRFKMWKGKNDHTLYVKQPGGRLVKMRQQ